MISVNVSGADHARQVLQKVARQMPFAMSLALNKTANAVQQAVRDELPGRFTVRRNAWLKNTIYRNRGTDFATKSRLQAIVRIHPDRDVLAKHEAGGTKVPTSGQSLAIPTANVRRNRSDIVTKANRPRALMANPKVFRQEDTLYRATGTGKRRKLIALFRFVRSARIRPRLGMQQTADRVVPDVWERMAREAIEQALRTAR